MSIETDIWYKDIFGFLSDYDKFVPTDSMTLNEKLNSIVRLALYVSFIHYLIFNDSSIFTVTVCTMLITAMYYLSKREFYAEYKSLAENEKGSPATADSVQIDCTKPKKQNPFMNVLMNEYSENPDRPEACDVDDNIVKTKMNDAFFHDETYREIDDVFDRKTSYRQFFTMPNTQIPNKQDDYANWLYKVDGGSYKEGNGMRHSNFAKYY